MAESPELTHLFDVPLVVTSLWSFTDENTGAKLEKTLQQLADGVQKGDHAAGSVTSSPSANTSRRDLSNWRTSGAHWRATTT